MRKTTCLIPLALGTFGLGLTEYVMMGILPDTAKSMHVSIPMAGHFISLYAIGVIVGAILLIVFGRAKPLKHILIVLVGIFTVANLASAFAPNYLVLCILRFIAGFPHGAFFGVGSIAAEKIADSDKASQAVATMISGMTFANLVGIPFGTFISHSFSWRITFLLIGLFGFLILYYVIKLVPRMKPLPDNGFLGQFKFFKSLGPWLLVIAVVTGNGGIFCLYSYINPLLVQTAGIPAKYVSLLMILAGAGMCIGNFVSGRLADKYPVSLVAGYTQLIACVALALMFFFSHNPVSAVFLMCICTACLFAVGAPQQLLLIRNSKGGEMLGSSCSQMSFNLGNAIGAFVGGIPIAHGLGYQYTAVPGALFAFIGTVMLMYFYKRYESKQRAGI